MKYLEFIYYYFFETVENRVKNVELLKVCTILWHKNPMVIEYKLYNNIMYCIGSSDSQTIIVTFFFFFGVVFHTHTHTHIYIYIYW